MDNIIDILNRFIDKKREYLNIDSKGFFVLGKSFKSGNTGIKSLRVAQVEVVYINKKENINDKVFCLSISGYIPKSKEEETMNTLLSDLTIKVLEWIDSKEYYKYLNNKI